jgi:excisionase family DNA binding protein
MAWSSLIRAPPMDSKLLHTRHEAAKLLGVSYSTIRRMEAEGRLRPIRPSGAKRGRVFYTWANLLEVAGVQQVSSPGGLAPSIPAPTKIANLGA